VRSQKSVIKAMVEMDKIDIAPLKHAYQTK
jgi:hypothetical protein